jgi:hypothetical protein
MDPPKVRQYVLVPQNNEGMLFSRPIQQQEQIYLEKSRLHIKV